MAGFYLKYPNFVKFHKLNCLSETEMHTHIHTSIFDATESANNQKIFL